MTFTVGFDTSALDPDFKGHAQRGIGRYVAELHRYFSSATDLPVRIASFDQRMLHQPSVASSLIDHLPAGRRTLSQQLLYPLRLNRGAFRQFDVVHFPAHMDAPAWSPKPYVLTVLDLIPLVLSDLYRADRPSWRFHFARFLEKSAIRSASLILAISECTARDVVRILGIPRERIVVTHLGVDERFFVEPDSFDESAVRAGYQIPLKRPVVLYVGGIDQRKNMPTLIQAFRELRDRARQEQREIPVLVMAGGISRDRQYPKLLKLVEQEGVKADVIMTGFVPDEDLRKIYALSSVFFFPSLYEGFGLPPLEAMAAGVPVVSSGSSSMPEILSGSAILVDPVDVRAAVEGLMQVIYDPVVAGQMRDSGISRARRFTWEATARFTVAAYELFRSGLAVPRVVNG